MSYRDYILNKLYVCDNIKYDIKMYSNIYFTIFYKYFRTVEKSMEKISSIICKYKMFKDKKSEIKYYRDGKINKIVYKYKINKWNGFEMGIFEDDEVNVVNMENHDEKIILNRCFIIEIAAIIILSLLMFYFINLNEGIICLTIFIITCLLFGTHNILYYLIEEYVYNKKSLLGVYVEHIIDVKFDLSIYSEEDVDKIVNKLSYLEYDKDNKILKQKVKYKRLLQGGVKIDEINKTISTINTILTMKKLKEVI